MPDEAKTTPTWGYSNDGPQIFDLKEGEKLPKGYYDSPAKVPSADDKPKDSAV